MLLRLREYFDPYLNAEGIRMTTMFNRKVFFDTVRQSLFSGSMSQSQVDGMTFKLDVWENVAHKYPDDASDMRYLAYPLATSYHETGQRMFPVREGFCNTDAEARAYVTKHGYDYAKVDPITGEVYYGRGDVQMTWSDNYKKATSALGLTQNDDLYWFPERALDPKISAMCMFKGMWDGWYRSDQNGRQTLRRHFNDITNDAYMAREIINGDKAKVPDWSNGVSIGNLIAGYHEKFLEALNKAWIEPKPEPSPGPANQIIMSMQAPPGMTVKILINGEVIEV